MAIAFGAGTGSNNQITTSLTYASPTVSGSDTWGTVGIKIIAALDDVSSVTWNGLTLTRIDTRAGPNAGEIIYIYGGAGVSTGNIVVNSTVSVRIISVAMYHTGVNQTGQPDAFTNASGTGTSFTTSVTSVADNCWMLLYAAAKDTPGNGVQAGTGSTKRGSSNDDNNVFDNNAAITPPGSNSMTVTQTNSEAFATIAFTVSPSGATASGSRNTNFSLLGVGQ